VIDTHCHLLPAIDDGPRTEPDFVRLARVLADEGVTRIVCTPHYSTLHDAPVSLVHDRLERAREVLTMLEIPLELEAGAEVSVERALAAPATELHARAIAGEFLLVELVADVPAQVPERVLERLAEEGLRPIFAHPERWLARTGALAIVDGLQNAGALLQIVAPSLIGTTSAHVWRIAWELVVSGRADFVGSDAHRAGGRRVRLRALAELLDERCGVERRMELLVGAPGRLLAGAL
jgi:protein-tyrosine phosphatase